MNWQAYHRKHPQDYQIKQMNYLR